MDKQQVTSRQSSPFQRSGAHGKIYELKRIDTNTITNDQDNEDLTKLNFPFTTSSSYEGMWENTMKHGYGTQSLQDGTKYEGNWKFNKKQGQGSLYTKKSGKKLQLTYEGSWANNMKEGHGSYFYSNGDHYKGDWKLDKRSGHGRLETISGDVYEGSWVDGKLSGEAHAILSNRNVFVGRYKEGKRSGYGRLYYHETGRVYEGKWVDDAPVCGEYRDPIQDEFTLFGLSSLPEKQFVEGKEGEKVGLKPLPVLELCNPDEVLTAQQKGKE